MKLDTPEISWHGKEPVLSIDFSKTGSTWRLASAGADNDVKIWTVVYNEQQHVEIEFLASLNRHTKAVNVVRFSPKEEIVASGGDDCMIILWKLNSSTEKVTNETFMDTDDVQNKESWTFYKALRGHIEDVYDLAWSPDGNSLVSGSVDNSAIIWDVLKGQKLMILKDHKHYVQGVCWDPLGQYIVTNSSDRSCRLYNSNLYRCCYNINKLQGNGALKTTEKGEVFKQGKMFHDETMPSFFRRPGYSPDGCLLFVPAGRLDVGDQVVNATYVFTRKSPNKPILYLPSPQKASVAVCCCPILFELRPHCIQDSNGTEDESPKSLFKLPYRMVFAVATLDSILLYDTQQKSPFGYISNIHYAALTDLTWSNDGRILVVSSSDGYCTLVHFHDGELGKVHNLSAKDVLARRSISPSLQSNIDMPAIAGKLNNKITPSPCSESPSSEDKADEMIQSSVKKETAGRISLFAIPMKATPTKPVPEPSAKCLATAQFPGANNLTTASPANQLTPRRVTLLPVTSKTNQPSTSIVNEQEKQVTSKHVPLIPAENNQRIPKRATLLPAQWTKQPITPKDEVKPVNQVTSTRVETLPVEDNQLTTQHETLLPPNARTDEVKPASQIRCNALTALETRPETENTNKPVKSNESMNLCQSPVPVLSTPRRIQLTTLSSVVGSAVQEVTLPQYLKGNASFHQPDHKLHQPTSQEDTTFKQDSSTLAKPEPMEIQLKLSTEVHASQVKAPLPLVGNQESFLVPLNDMDTSKTHSINKVSRMTLKSLNVETSKSNSNQMDKENGSNGPLLGHNSQLKPKRVALVTLGSENGEQTISSDNNNSSPYELKLSTRKPIPLEPTVIVLDDN